MAPPCSVEVRFFRMLNGLVEPRIRAGWGSPRLVPGGIIVLETKGRRTGRRAKVPLAAFRISDHILVSTFRGGRSQWVKNLSADPDVRYWLRGRPRKARALVISSGQRTQSRKGLPAVVRWLVRSLTPYTYAGWAFAVLRPVAAPERKARGAGRRAAAMILLAALSAFATPADAGCPPIEVRLAGTITREADGSPVANLPVTIRMEGEAQGLVSIQWDAVVTDRDGRYAWSKTFPRDPCREGNPMLDLPGRAWGWIAHPRGKAYRHQAKGLPERIRLQTEHRSVPIPRSRLIDGLDPSGLISTVTIDFSL